MNDVAPENNNETSTMMNGYEHGGRRASPPPLPGGYCCHAAIVATTDDAEIVRNWQIAVASSPLDRTLADPAAATVDLAGRYIVIIPPANKDGHDHAREIAGTLSRMGATTKVVMLPNIAEGESIAAWSRLPGNDRDALLHLIHQTPEQREAPQESLPVAGLESFSPFPPTMKIEFRSSYFRCAGKDQTISIIAYVRDEHQESWGKLCEITNLDGHTHRMVIPMSDFAGNTNELFKKLLSRGILVPMDKNSRNRLCEFLLEALPLDDRRALIVRKCGWRHRVFVMPDRAIGTPPEMVVYDPGANASATARFAALGSTAQWQTGTGALCIGNSRLIFSVCCSFAAAMLTPLGIGGGCFNLVCTSSAGKTTILGVSASVCGGPDYLRTWWTTDNGLAEVAAGHNDSLLILDEMGQVLPAKIGDIAYMLANGKGKIRASPRSAIQPERTWRLLALSSGEITISEHMDEAGKKIKAGQEVRIVDIPADAGAGYGIFECLHGFASPEKLAMTLEHNGSQAYGSPLVGFLEQFTADFENCVALARSFMDDFLSQYQPPDATPQQRRVIRRFAVVAAAGEIAGRLGVTGWPEGEAMRGVATCLRDWWDDKHGNDRQEADRIIAQVHRFIESQGGGRFYDLRDTDAPDNETVCFRHQINEQVVDFFISSDVFHKEVCTGFDPAKVCRLLRDRGILVASGKRNTRVRRVNAYGKKVCRYYCLRISTVTDK